MKRMFGESLGPLIGRFKQDSVKTRKQPVDMHTGVSFLETLWGESKTRAGM